MRTSVKPTVSEPSKHGAITYSHPAYACVQVTRQTGDRILFGSDLPHNQTVCITISHAVNDRSHNHNHIHQEKQIVEIVVSESQWASIVANATGKSIPATLLWDSVGGYTPEIEVVNENELFRNDMKRQVRETTAKITALTQELREALKQPTLKKKEIERITHDLECANGNLPSNIAYVNEVFHKTIEEKTIAMKTDVESYFNAKLNEIGMNAIADGTARTNEQVISVNTTTTDITHKG